MKPCHWCEKTTKLNYTKIHNVNNNSHVNTILAFCSLKCLYEWQESKI